MLRRLWQLRRKPEDIALDVYAAVERFSTQQAESLDEERNTRQELVNQLTSDMHTLWQALHKLQSHPMEELPTMFADIAGNIAQRADSVAQTDLDDEMAIRHCLAHIGTLKEKEIVVLNKLKPGKMIVSTLDSLRNTLDRINEIDQQSLLATYAQLQYLVRQFQRIEQRIAATKQQLQELDTEVYAERKQQLREELDALYASEDWQRKEQLKAQIADCEKQRVAIDRSLQTAVSSVERCLKKLDYHGGGAFQPFISHLRQHRWDQIIQPEMVLQKAADQLPALVDDKQVEKWKESQHVLEQIPDKYQQMEQLREQKIQLQTQLNTITVEQQAQRLQDQMEQQDRLATSVEEQRVQLQETLKQLKTEQRQITQRIEDILNQHLFDQYTITFSSDEM